MPELDWSPARASELGHAAVDLWAEWLEKLRSLPVTRRTTPREVRAAVALPFPEEPLPNADLLAHARTLMFEQSTYSGNPAFLAYIMGAGTLPAAVAELLSAALNQNVGGWRLSPGATEIEAHLLRWFADRFGLPEGAGGIMVSGGALANFTGLKVARDIAGGAAVRTRGLYDAPRLVLYASERAHVTVQRAADLLGLGRLAVRKIPTDERFRLHIDALRKQIDADRCAHLAPFAVVGTAGTTATGSIDPLPEIAELCAREALWFHVDAAYGGAAALWPETREAFQGLSRADSITFDPHKWLYIPQSASCVLFRRASLAAESFVADDDYVYEAKDQTGSGVDFSDFGPQWSRGFAAFKVWFSILAHGERAYARRISHDMRLAHYLARRIDARSDFERMAPVGLSICCFRYAPPDLAPSPRRDAYLDQLNERLMTAVQSDGRTFISNAVLNGRFALRVCITNFRTEAADLDRVLDVAAELGARLHAEAGQRTT